MGKSMNRPKVTVLMPVYNAKNYVREAVDSILNQTFRNFELLIINDGSVDTTQSILSSYKDPRIRIITHKKNMGIVRCLNEGLSLAQSTYIARMDADDIALPSRLEKQVAFMDKHPGIAVCGTWLKAIFDTKSEIWKVPVSHNEIQSLMLFHDAVFHPTVMMRIEIIKKYNFQYKTTYPYAEDYELWLRMMGRSRFANTPEVLLLHRIHQHVHQDDYLAIQQKSAAKIQRPQIYSLGIHPNKNEMEIHTAISNWNLQSNPSFVHAAEKWLMKLMVENLKTNKYPYGSFIKLLLYKWFLLRWRGNRHE